MGRRRVIPGGRRPATNRKAHEGYRVQAIDYVTNRDAKIDEIVADIRRKYPRMAEAEARRIVTEHWAAMERANDTRNTVRSLDMGFDERAMIDRLNGKLNDRLRDKLPSRLPDRLSDVLRGAPAGTYSRLATESHDPVGVDPLSSEAVMTIIESSIKLAGVHGHGDNGETARHWIYSAIGTEAQRGGRS